MNSEKEVFEIIERLKREENALILIEGRRDAESLKNIGIESEIICISQKNMYDLTLDLVKKDKKIIILTDFDSEGTHLFKEYRKELESLGAIIDATYYRELKFHLKKFIKGIEDIDNFLFTHQTSRPYSYNPE
jgi:2,5-diamino-6-(ribosylamino)-4(3H)-pyrimidinone 5'-phosphate reductase